MKGITIFILCLAVIGVSWCGVKDASAANGERSVSGTVVDSGQNFVSIRDSEGRTIQVDVPAGAMIMNGNKSGTAEDLKVGDTVVIRYGNNGEVMQVERGIGGSSTMPEGNH